MSSLPPFTPVSTAILAVTDATGSAALNRSGSNQILIYSPAANDDAFIRFGDSTVEAEVTDIAIGPGFSRIFTIPNGATHVAGIAGATETATLYFTSGDGE